MKNPKNVKRGKKSKAAGAAFELRVRKDLEEKGWVIDKWSNNVEFNSEVLRKPIAMCEIKDPLNIEDVVGIRIGKLIPAKAKFRGPGIPMMMSAGFPDFVCFKNLKCKMAGYNSIHEVVGVEVKTNGYLDKLEREKCRWYLDNKIFSQILIASKTKVKNKIKIIYTDFTEKYK